MGFAVCFYGAPVVAMLMMWQLIQALNPERPKDKRGAAAGCACILCGVLTVLFMIALVYASR